MPSKASSPGPACRRRLSPQKNRPENPASPQEGCEYGEANVVAYLRAREVVPNGSIGRRGFKGRASVWARPGEEERQGKESVDCAWDVMSSSSHSSSASEAASTPIARGHRAYAPSISPSAPSSLSPFISRQLPSTLHERQFPLQDHDKIFASAWLSDSEVVFGTKCNKLFVLNVDTGKRVEIPSVGCHALPSSPSPAAAKCNSSDDRSSRNSRRNSIMPDHNHCSGVHSIAINPSRTLIAIGAGEPTEYIQVYRLPTFDPHAVLTGHMDMVFSVAWIDDHTLISGSRDTSVKMWRVAPSDSITSSSPTPFHPIISTLPTLSGTPISIIPPVLSRQSHRSKVRDLQFNPHANRSAAAATLSTDGTVKIWDVSTLTVADSIPLFHTNETVCLALDAAAGTYAVGSQCHISFVDPRVAAVVASVDSVDEGWGVRSLSIDNGVMTVGGGLGRLSFFDVRAQRYIGWEHQDADKRNFGNPLNHGTPAKDGSPIQYLAVGAGWLQHDQVYMNHFQGLEVRNAVYTLSYDRTGTRLFAAGGPLQLNLRGCYAGLW